MVDRAHHRGVVPARRIYRRGTKFFFGALHLHDVLGVVNGPAPGYGEESRLGAKLFSDSPGNGNAGKGNAGDGNESDFAGLVLRVI